MPKKVKKFVCFLDKFEWNNILMGGIMVLASLGMFFNYSASMYELTIAVGLLAILKGFLNFNLYYLTEESFEDTRYHYSFLISATACIIIGLLMIFNLFSSDMVLRTFAASWFIIDTIPHLILIQLDDLKDTRSFHLYTIVYSVSILCGVLILFNSLSTYISPALLVGGFLLSSGGNLIAKTLYE